MKPGIDLAVAQLAKSRRGRNAMRRLLEWMEDDDGLGLDQSNQEAYVHLVYACWGPVCGTALDAIRDEVVPTD